MKSLLIIVNAVLFLFPNFNGTSNDHLLKQSEAQITTAVLTSIVMEDDIMMLTTTDSSNGTITTIKVKTLSGSLVSTYAGCGASTCRTDMSGLNNGNYLVEVTTSTGHEFSGSITISN